MKGRSCPRALFHGHTQSFRLTHEFKHKEKEETENQSTIAGQMSVSKIIDFVCSQKSWGVDSITTLVLELKCSINVIISGHIIPQGKAELIINSLSKAKFSNMKEKINELINLKKINMSCPCILKRVQEFDHVYY